MALRCQICGKGRTVGKSGAHKYGGKWAMRATKKRRVWKPNLQNYTVNGKKMRLCTRCIKRIKFEQKKAGEVKKSQLIKAQEVKIPEKVEIKKEEKETKKKTSRKSTKKS